MMFKAVFTVLFILVSFGDCFPVKESEVPKNIEKRSPRLHEFERNENCLDSNDGEGCQVGAENAEEEIGDGDGSSGLSFRHGDIGAPEMQVNYVPYGGGGYQGGDEQQYDEQHGVLYRQEDQDAEQQAAEEQEAEAQGGAEQQAEHAYGAEPEAEEQAYGEEEYPIQQQEEELADGAQLQADEQAAGKEGDAHVIHIYHADDEGGAKGGADAGQQGGAQLQAEQEQPEPQADYGGEESYDEAEGGEGCGGGGQPQQPQEPHKPQQPSNRGPTRPPKGSTTPPASGGGGSCCGCCCGCCKGGKPPSPPPKPTKKPTKRPKPPTKPPPTTKKPKPTKANKIAGRKTTPAPGGKGCDGWCGCVEPGGGQQGGGQQGEELQPGDEPPQAEEPQQLSGGQSAGRKPEAGKEAGETHVFHVYHGGEGKGQQGRGQQEAEPQPQAEQQQQPEAEAGLQANKAQAGGGSHVIHIYQDDLQRRKREAPDNQDSKSISESEVNESRRQKRSENKDADKNLYSQTLKILKGLASNLNTWGSKPNAWKEKGKKVLSDIRKLYKTHRQKSGIKKEFKEGKSHFTVIPRQKYRKQVLPSS